MDLHELLTYELSSVPHSLFNQDGSMRKISKVQLSPWLKQDLAKAKMSCADEETVIIVDFMEIVHMVCMDKLDCGTFGDLSEILLRTVLSTGQKFNAVVFYYYKGESKGREIQKRPSKNCRNPKFQERYGIARAERQDVANKSNLFFFQNQAGTSTSWRF